VNVVVQAKYIGDPFPWRTYTFEAEQGTCVGDRLFDGDQAVHVMAVVYDGPRRTLTRSRPQAAQTSGGAATPTPAQPHRGGGEDSHGATC
jgi:hypothetical protein